MKSNNKYRDVLLQENNHLWSGNSNNASSHQKVFNCNSDAICHSVPLGLFSLSLQVCSVHYKSHPELTDSDILYGDVCECVSVCVLGLLMACPRWELEWKY